MNKRIFAILMMIVSMGVTVIKAQNDNTSDAADALSAEMKCISTDQKPLYRNIYAELFGASNMIGLSYDSRIKPGSPFGYRAGLSYIAGSSRTLYDSYDTAFGIGIPMAFNCILGKHKSKFEVSFGLSMGIYSADESIFLDEDGNPTLWNPVYMIKKRHTLFGYFFFSEIGYRYQRKNGFMLRVGVSPSFNFGDSHGVSRSPILYPYLCLGYTLK